MACQMVCHFKLQEWGPDPAAWTGGGPAAPVPVQRRGRRRARQTPVDPIFGLALASGVVVTGVRVGQAGTDGRRWQHAAAQLLRCASALMTAAVSGIHRLELPGRWQTVTAYGVTMTRMLLAITAPRYG